MPPLALPALAGLAALAWWVVGLPAFSGRAAAAVLAAGAGAMAVGAVERARRPHPGRPPAGDLPAGGWRWAALAGLAAAWQLAAYVQAPRHEHPTISSLTNALLDSHPARAAMFVLWLAAARELARR